MGVTAVLVRGLRDAISLLLGGVYVKLEAIRFGRHTYTTTVPYDRPDAKIFDDIYQTLTTPIN